MHANVSLGIFCRYYSIFNSRIAILGIFIEYAIQLTFCMCSVQCAPSYRNPAACKPLQTHTDPFKCELFDDNFAMGQVLE